MYTWIVSCTDQVRFFSMQIKCASFRCDAWWALLFDERPFFRYRFFFWEGVLLATAFLVLFLHRWTVLLATAFFCSLRYRVRDILLVLYALNWIISSKPLSIWRWCCLVLIRFNSLSPTASAVRYYTVIQPCFDCCGSLLSCQATWYVCCWVCVQRGVRNSTQHWLSCYLPSIFAIRWLIRTDDLVCQAIRLLSYSVCVWSSGQSLPAPNTLVVCTFRFTSCWAIRLLCYWLWVYWSIGLINIMLFDI